MPGAERRDQPQPAVLLRKLGVDEANEPVLADAEEILVRCIKGRAQVPDPQGTLITLDARALVTEEIAIGSLLWLGELADWLGTGSVAVNTELHEVVTYTETNDLKGRHTTRRLGLRKFRDPEGSV